MLHEHATCRMRTSLKKLPDLEKLLAKLFTFSIKHSVEAIYFEDVSLAKLREFRQVLECFKRLRKVTLSDLTGIEFSSKRL